MTEVVNKDSTISLSELLDLQKQTIHEDIENLEKSALVTKSGAKNSHNLSGALEHIVENIEG